MNNNQTVVSETNATVTIETRRMHLFKIAENGKPIVQADTFKRDYAAWIKDNQFQEKKFQTLLDELDHNRKVVWAQLQAENSQLSGILEPTDDEQKQIAEVAEKLVKARKTIQQGQALIDFIKANYTLSAFEVAEKVKGKKIDGLAKSQAARIHTFQTPQAANVYAEKLAKNHKPFTWLDTITLVVVASKRADKASK